MAGKWWKEEGRGWSVVEIGCTQVGSVMTRHQTSKESVQKVFLSQVCMRTTGRKDACKLWIRVRLKGSGREGANAYLCQSV